MGSCLKRSKKKEEKKRRDAAAAGFMTMTEYFVRTVRSSCAPAAGAARLVKDLLTRQALSVDRYTPGASDSAATQSNSPVKGVEVLPNDNNRHYKTFHDDDERILENNTKITSSVKKVFFFLFVVRDDMPLADLHLLLKSRPTQGFLPPPDSLHIRKCQRNQKKKNATTAD